MGGLRRRHVRRDRSIRLGPRRCEVGCRLVFAEDRAEGATRERQRRQVEVSEAGARAAQGDDRGRRLDTRCEAQPLQLRRAVRERPHKVDIAEARTSGEVQRRELCGAVEKRRERLPPRDQRAVRGCQTVAGGEGVTSLLLWWQIRRGWSLETRPLTAAAVASLQLKSR